MVGACGGIEMLEKLFLRALGGPCFTKAFESDKAQLAQALRPDMTLCFLTHLKTVPVPALGLPQVTNDGEILVGMPEVEGDGGFADPIPYMLRELGSLGIRGNAASLSALALDLTQFV